MNSNNLADAYLSKQNLGEKHISDIDLKSDEVFHSEFNISNKSLSEKQNGLIENNIYNYTKPRQANMNQSNVNMWMLVIRSLK